MIQVQTELNVADNTGADIVGVVIVLLVRVSVVALPTRVSVAAGNVTVTSAVAAGPASVTELVPLSVPSLNNIFPALVASVAFKTGASKTAAVLTLTCPLDTENESLLKLATPLLEVVASSLIAAVEEST